ncbi:hypothetical protein WJX73_008263 [Symbiochloris irregularis]|uniref:Kinesin-like protein n=1 Tax=Symbiochloris irregularis TaxID=706552 RepID=A0AAW1PDH5_9CHLO
MEEQEVRESGLFPRDLNSLFSHSLESRKRKDRPAVDTTSANVVAGTGATDSEQLERLQVLVRIRPLEQRGPGVNWESCVHATSDCALVIAAPEDSQAYKSGDRGQPYSFSGVHGQHTTQEEYFAATAAPMVARLANGCGESAVFMAYGISASGKTYTIEGTKEEPGILPLSIEMLFQELGKLTAEKARVMVSHYEVYHESIFDLLEQARKPQAVGPRPALYLKEDANGRVFVAGLAQVEVSDAASAIALLRKSSRQRQRAATGVNAQSSRSHSVFVVTLWGPGEPLCSLDSDACDGLGDQGQFWGRLSIVDLAGSERATQTGNQGVRLKESVAINSSLMTLGRCLEALRWNQRHAGADQRIVPYRESKVTHLFRDALRGWGRIVLSVSIRPAACDYDATLRVLRYAATAAQINIVATAAAAPPRPPGAASPKLHKKRRLQDGQAPERQQQQQQQQQVQPASLWGLPPAARGRAPSPDGGPPELQAEVQRLQSENEHLAEENARLAEAAIDMRQGEAERELVIRAEVAQESRHILQQMQAEYQERVAAAKLQLPKAVKSRQRMTLLLPQNADDLAQQPSSEAVICAASDQQIEGVAEEDARLSGEEEDGDAAQDEDCRLERADKARDEERMQLQANLGMNTEILERALEQARKDNAALQHRLEVALGLQAPTSQDSKQGTPVPGGTPLAIALARARHEAALQGLSAHVHLTPCAADRTPAPAEALQAAGDPSACAYPAAAPTDINPSAQTAPAAEVKKATRRAKWRLAPKTPMAEGFCTELGGLTPENDTSSPIAGRTRFARRG